MNKNTLDRIKDIVGITNFSDSIEDKIVFSYDATPIYNKQPEAVVFPENPEQIQKLFTLANDSGFSIVPRGSGTGLSGGSVPSDNSIVMVLNKWNRIIELDQLNQTMWVEPGVITEQIDAKALKHGLFYPPDPGSAKISTIGGNVAENAGGLRGLKYGVTKNYVMGFEMVSPTGELFVIGGKNIKDVAGYNLRDIMVGSEGTLGVFTKILLKLIPRPKNSKTILAFFKSAVTGGEVVSEIISSNIVPSMMEFLDNTTIKCVEDYTHIGLNTGMESLLIMEIDGWDTQVEFESDKIVEICRKKGVAEVIIAENLSDSNRLKSARRSAFSSLARIKPTTILEDATVPRSRLGEMVEAVIGISKENDVMIGNFGHAGDGNLHPTILSDENQKNEILKAERALDRIFNTAIRLGGTITGEHGVGISKKQFLESSVGSHGLDFMRKIKSVMDPNNILNPGKIFTIKPKCEGKLPNNLKEIKSFNV